MAQINNQQILDNTITGGSIAPEMGFYSETENYAVDDVVSWHHHEWKVVTAVTGTNKGNLLQAPDLSANWEIIGPSIISVYPTTAQAYNNTTGIMVKYDTIRFKSGGFNLDPVTGEVEVTEGGGCFISVGQTNRSTQNTRATSLIYVETKTTSGSWTRIPNFYIASYSRNTDDGESTAFASIPYLFELGEKVRVNVTEQSGDAVALETQPDGCNLTVYALVY